MVVYPESLVSGGVVLPGQAPDDAGADEPIIGGLGKAHTTEHVKL